jgi:hypothetical protein
LVVGRKIVVREAMCQPEMSFKGTFVGWRDAIDGRAKNESSG